jgi:CzcA family heavy metal efflux pump
MKRLIAWSIDHHWLVISVAALLLGTGVWLARHMPVDIFPDLTAPTVTVLVEGHGMAPEELEALATFPIETAMNGASGVRRVRSSTTLGLAVVWVEFDWGADIMAARQVVAEKLTLVAGGLPDQVDPPVLAPISSIMGEILFFALTAPDVPVIELRTLADTVVRRRLLAVPGVSQVTPLGGEVRQFQVIADPARLRAQQVSVTELVDGVARSSQNASAGIYRDGDQEFVVQAIGRADTVQALGESVVTIRGSRPVLVRDVATVREGAALKRGDAARNGEPAVVIGVQKQPDANTIELTRRLDVELDALAAELPHGIEIDRRVFRQADFIQVAVDNVAHALRDGSLLVVIIVVAFLANLRAATITLLAIPLSLAAAVLVLRAFGASINTMTLGGLAIAIGAVVDDAVIDVENVVRRLRENAGRVPADRRQASRVVRDATLEIRGSIVFATLIIVLVFLPLFALSGVEGRLLAPLALAYVAALAASLAVAIVITPALCYAFLPQAASIVRGHDGWVSARLKAVYRRTLPMALDRPKLVMAVSALLLVVAVAAASRMGRAFLPEFHEGTLTVTVTTLPGTSLDKSSAIGRDAEQILLGVPEVVATARRTGRAERDEHAQSVETAEIDVALRASARSRDELLADVRTRFAALSGATVSIGQPISHRIDHMLSGTRANIAIKVFGDDLVTLRQIGARIRRAVENVEGVADLAVEQQTDVPFVRFHLDRQAAARYGVRVGDVTDAIETALAGRVVGVVFSGPNAFDLVVRFDPEAARDLEALASLPVETPSGAVVPVRAVAHVRREYGPNAIGRENVQRRIVVAANIAGRDLGSVIDEIREAVEQQVRLPAGYRVEYGGQFERQRTASRQLALLGAAAVGGIFMLLLVAFGRVRDVVIVMVNLPLALIGGVAGVFLAGGVLSIAALIGFITLFGIATRNGIMLVSHIQHLQREEQVRDFREAVERGAQERIVPILMTALATGLALVPLALGGGRAGSEIQTPMAIVILCGLASSTLLNMAVVPTLYFRFGERQPRVRDAALEGDPQPAG